jgi:ATP-binding cassette, subfamily B, bacterial
MAFPFYKQYDCMDCGPSCLRMIAKHYGKNFSLQSLRDKSGIHRQGVSLLGISEAAEAIGMRSLGAKVDYDTLLAKVPLPCIAHWQQKHFVVVHGIERKKSLTGRYKEVVHVADPAKGLLTYSAEEFKSGWLSSANNSSQEGVLLLLETTMKFREADDHQVDKLGFKQLFGYLFAYKKLLIQLLLGLFVGSLLQLILPFLTQAVVDVGIRTQNIGFIYLILMAQLMLFAGKTSVEFIRGWILLHIGSRINLTILSDFLMKLMRLPLAYFDVKLFGDLIRRINDHERIRYLLTTSSLNVVFSLFNLLIFGGVLYHYSTKIFFTFFFASLLYAGWATLFLGPRRQLDFKLFDEGARNHSKMVQLIQGMQEIKMNNCENSKRWEWERIQARVFKLNVQELVLTQYQLAGAFFVNEGKNIFITFLAAKAVIEGELTLGAMLAIQYIIGQLNSPVEQLIQFLQSLQSAQISLERLNEIHQIPDEEPADHTKAGELPTKHDFHLRNVAFQYPGAISEPVLKNIDLHIRQGKTTAIVGMSGSGKTTLLKLLLKFYEPTTGAIFLGDIDLANISHRLWRSECGIVMQDGFIFSDTIARNIAVGDEELDRVKLAHAIKVANIQDFVSSLPLGYNTKIGMEGNGISQGQKQRILIARAVYKDPAFILFDEATNALDSTNESLIMQNLEKFFLGRTVIVVAHRLSTVRKADHIVVISKGEIVEQGTHDELIHNFGDYYTLVKNQLEIAA